MKIIKAAPATSTQLGTSGAYSKDINNVGKYYFWNIIQNGSGDGKNNWKTSNLNTENLNEYYLNTYLGKGTSRIDSNPNKWQSMIADHTWITAGNAFDNIRKQKVRQAYENEIVHPDKGTKFPTAAETVNAKVGLMYVSDYGYAAYKDAWTTKTLYDYYDANTKANNWLKGGNELNFGEWTITRITDKSDDSFYVDSDGTVSYDGVDYCYIDDYNAIKVRPVLYLKSSAKISSGNGTFENPYVLEMD